MPRYDLSRLRSWQNKAGAVDTRGLSTGGRLVLHLVDLQPESPLIVQQTPHDVIPQSGAGAWEAMSIRRRQRRSFRLVDEGVRRGGERFP